MPSSRPVLTLIDASGFVFRAYHAITTLNTSRGVPTNAVYGFTRMLLKTLREMQPTHVALAFDTESRRRPPGDRPHLQGQPRRGPRPTFPSSSPWSARWWTPCAFRSWSSPAGRPTTSSGP